MARDNRNYVRLGVLVTTGVLLFIVAVYFIGNTRNLFGPKFYLNTVISNANGLREGNNVRYAGIVVGSVEDIIFVNDSTLRVEMSLEEEVKNFIRKDAVASIGMDGLVGNVIVNISPGSGNQPRVKNGGTIASYSRTSSDYMLETLNRTNENIAVLSEKLLEFSKSLNDGQGTLPLLVNDADVANDLVQTLKNLHLTSENLSHTSSGLKATMKSVGEGRGTLGYLVNDQTLPHQLENLATRFDSLLIVQGRPVMENLRQSSEDIAASSAKLKAATKAMERGDGLAATILNDTAASNKLLEILTNLDEGTARFNENMEAMKHNFLFRRYFRKMEKQGKN
jgi:phospholipid/cholesterol/gamma-HCH transport system substrate-binding protein